MSGAERAEPNRDETPAERSDRNWAELLQEVRVAQIGIQILSGFLLTVPFESRFTELSPLLMGIFLAAAGFATLSALLVIAPVSLHRILFRQHVKQALVNVSDILARMGLVCLAATITLAAGLVFGFVLGEAAGLASIGVAAVAFIAIWLILPLVVRARLVGRGEA